MNATKKSACLTCGCETKAWAYACGCGGDWTAGNAEYACCCGTENAAADPAFRGLHHVGRDVAALLLPRIAASGQP